MSQFFEKIKRYYTHKKNNFYIRFLSKLDRFGYLNSKNVKDIKSKKIFYSVSLWGEEYIKIFNDVLIPSLLQKNNLPKLKKFGCIQRLIIYTKNNESPLSKKNELKLKKYLFIEIVKNQNFKNDEDPKIYLKNSLLSFIDYSLKDDAYSMVLTPDHVYGDGSIYNIFISAYGKDIGVACIGARINWKKSHKLFKSIFLKKKILSNTNLVKITFNNLHPAFKQSININSSFIHSLNIEQIHRDTYLVSSSRVNVCIVKFNKNDYEFFKSILDYNNIDFYWPRMLIKEGRYKFIGDSDFIFYSELTKENLKFAKINKHKKVHNLYAGSKRLINHIVNDSYYSLWKIKN